MSIISYLVLAFFLLLSAFLIFRIVVRRDYRQKGRLSPFSGFLELALSISYVFFPSIYNPPCWYTPWSCATDVSPALRITGLILVATGLLAAFSAMAWLGLSRSFGQKSDELVQTCFYGYSRNPQVAGGAPMVAGVVVLWPSLYALGWAVMYGIIFHMMVMTEEEHMHKIFGEKYERYCKRVPRYIGIRRSQNFCRRIRVDNAP